MAARPIYFVKVYDIDTTGTWRVEHDNALLSSVIPNDPTELARARRSLKASGRYWLTMSKYLSLRAEVFAR